MGVYIPNMEKPKECQVCPIFIWCYTNDWKGYEHCPLIEIVQCKDCKWFELDVWGELNGIPVIVAHEMCKFWGGGCKTNTNGFCSYGERRNNGNGIMDISDM